MTYPIGKSLPVASRLVRQSGQSPVYLVDDYGTGTILRHIVSEQAFNAFGFDWNLVQDVSPSDPVMQLPHGYPVRLMTKTFMGDSILQIRTQSKL